MATMGNVVTRVLDKLDNSPDLAGSAVELMAQTRYEELYHLFNWSRRHRDFVLTFNAQISSAASTAASVLLGDGTVTASGDPFPASYDGRQIDIDGLDQYLFIQSGAGSTFTMVDGEGTTVTWAASTASTASWRIFQTIYALPSDCDAIISLAADIGMQELSGGRATLDQLDPDRIATANTPSHWIHAGENTSAVREVEIWPIPTTARIVRGQYLKEPASLASTTTVDVPIPLMVWSTAADAADHLHVKHGTTEAMWAEKANIFRGHYNNLLPQYRFAEVSRTSPPRHLRRGFAPYSRRHMGTDYAIDHHTDLLW